jgi:type IV pilus modification protein PilV
MENIPETKRTKSISKRGFTLVEVLAALFILSIGLLMVASLMTANIKSSMNSRNQIIASDLAQEGVELAQNINDNSTSSANALQSGSYTVDYINGLGANPNPTNERLYLNGGFYSSNSSGGTPTKYFRKIDISVNGSGSGSQVTVTATVSWNGQNIPSFCTVANQCLSVTTVMISKN